MIDRQSLSSSSALDQASTPSCGSASSHEEGVNLTHLPSERPSPGGAAHGLSEAHGARSITLLRICLAIW